MNIQGTLFETETPQLPIHDVMCSCGFTDESPKVLFFVREVDYKTATKIVIENHYLHRQAPCSKAY